MNPRTLVTLGLGCLLLAVPAAFSAQQQDQDSLAEAARKAQAEKKNAPKPKMVLTDDNLDTLKGTISVVGEAPAPAAEDKSDTAAPKADKKAEKVPVKDEAYWRQAFATAYKKLADDSHDLDIMQRQSNLDQQQFYQDPMAALKQQYSRQDINDDKAKVDQLTAQVAQDKQDISNLQDELRQAGGDSGWATPPAQSPQGQSQPPQDQSQPQ